MEKLFENNSMFGLKCLKKVFSPTWAFLLIDPQPPFRPTKAIQHLPQRAQGKLFTSICVPLIIKRSWNEEQEELDKKFLVIMKQLMMLKNIKHLDPHWGHEEGEGG